MTHSPFPWRTHQQMTTGVFDADGKRIANTHGSSIMVDDDTAEDNAALIVRAVNGLPEAVAALEDTIAMLQGSKLTPAYECRLEAAIAALTKLKG